MRRAPFLAALLAWAVAACDPAGLTEPTEAELSSEDTLAPLLSSAQESAQKDRGSSLFDELASKIASFGGLYRAGHCTVVVVLTDMSEEKHALQVVHAALAPLVAKPCQGGVKVSAEEGEFTYKQLKAFLAAARPLLEIEGVKGVQINFKLNRLVVTVASRRVAQAVLEALPRLEIPQRAVTFKLADGRDGTGTTRGG